MIHRLLAVGILLVGILANHAPARGAVSELVRDISLSYVFGSSIQLQANIIDSASVKDAFLMLQAEGQSTRSIRLNPDSEGQINAAVDLRQAPLRPFARVYYWFECTFNDDRQATSASFWFDYNDNRFTWNETQDDLFQIAWVNGDTEFGRTALDSARRGLQAAVKILPVSPPIPIRIYIYPSEADLQSALDVTRLPWASGQASPDLALVLVSIPPSSGWKMEMERQLPHELMHLLQYAHLNHAASSIPAWLAEGLAARAELYPDPDAQRLLNRAVKDGSLPAFSSLCNGFPQEAQAASLAYAQSGAFIDFIQKTYGSSSIVALLNAAGDGIGCAEMVGSVLGETLPRLQQRWEDSLRGSSPPEKTWLIPSVLAVVFIPVVVIVLLSRRKGKGEKVR